MRVSGEFRVAFCGRWAKGRGSGVQGTRRQKSVCTCVALPTQENFFAESAIKLTTGSTSTSDFSCRTFRNSALAPNFSIDPIFGKADVSSLVHSRECVEAAAVCVPSLESELVVKV